jgi:hypothetical protein
MAEFVIERPKGFSIALCSLEQTLKLRDRTSAVRPIRPTWHKLHSARTRHLRADTKISAPPVSTLSISKARGDQDLSLSGFAYWAGTEGLPACHGGGLTEANEHGSSLLAPDSKRASAPSAATAPAMREWGRDQLAAGGVTLAELRTISRA